MKHYKQEGYVDQVHLKIHGRVQGVFFRANTQKEATRLNLTGWVRNTEDGAVEALALGEHAALESFIAWCHKGPPHAKVTKVDVKWEPAGPIGQGFQIKY